MSRPELVPDPFDDHAPAIVSDEHGTRLAPVVSWAPEGTDPRDTDKWRPIGWLTGQHYDPQQEEERP